MKKLGKMKLNDFNPMSESEMRNIAGGSGVVQSGICTIRCHTGVPTKWVDSCPTTGKGLSSLCSRGIEDLKSCTCAM